MDSRVRGRRAGAPRAARRRRTANPRPGSGCRGGLSWPLKVLLGLYCVSIGAGSAVEVHMAGESQTVHLKETAHISCKFSSPQPLDPKIIGVVWYRESQGEEDKLLEAFGDPPEVSFRLRGFISLENLRRGDASLRLPGVQVEDAGKYCCEVVVTPSKAQGSTLLKVIAQPKIMLFPEKASVKPHEDVTLSCMASYFFPENISMRWEKKLQNYTQFQEIPENATIGPLVRNKDDTFNISSTLKLKPSLKDNLAVYQCVIEHLGSGTIQSSFTLIVLGSETPTFPMWAIYVLCICPFLVCVFIALWCLRKKCPCNKSTARVGLEEDKNQILAGSMVACSDVSTASSQCRAEELLQKVRHSCLHTSRQQRLQASQESVKPLRSILSSQLA